MTGESVEILEWSSRRFHLSDFHHVLAKLVDIRMTESV
jgi:hypothetical protein